MYGQVKVETEYVCIDCGHVMVIKNYKMPLFKKQMVGIWEKIK